MTQKKETGKSKSKESSKQRKKSKMAKLERYVEEKEAFFELKTEVEKRKSCCRQSQREKRQLPRTRTVARPVVSRKIKSNQEVETFGN